MRIYEDTFSGTKIYPGKVRTIRESLQFEMEKKVWTKMDGLRRTVGRTI